MSRDKNRKICLEKICLVSVQSFGVFNGTRQRVIRYAYPLGACCVLRCLNGECESESAALLYVAELWLLASIGPVFFLSSAAVVLSEDNLPAPTNGAVNGPTFPVWPDECLVVLSCFFFQKKIWQPTFYHSSPLFFFDPSTEEMRVDVSQKRKPSSVSFWRRSVYF